jgi:hypothetical protein
LSWKLLFEDAEDFILTHDQIIDTVEFDLAARILAEEDAVTLLHVERNDLAILETLAFAYGENFAFLWFFLGALGDKEATAGLLGVTLDPFDHATVVKRTNVHYRNLQMWIDYRIYRIFERGSDLG